MAQIWGVEDRQLVEHLLHRVRAGDDLALARIYDDYSATVYGLALHITGNRRAAEEITQDSFVRLWEQPDLYDPARGGLRLWLAAMARRRAVDWLRRSGRQHERVERLVRERWRDVDSAEDAVIGDAVHVDAVHVAVRTAVDQLPEVNRRVLLLAYYGGLTYSDVARALGIPEGTVKSRMRTALQRLAADLAATGVPGG
jgi:RNA polymerase sigma factor (sigma-70 family)